MRPLTPPSMAPPPSPNGMVAARNSSHVGTVASPTMPMPMRAVASGRTRRRPNRSVRTPPPIEPTTYARALTKKNTPRPASVWSNAGSIDRISDGTRSPVQPTSIRAAQPRIAAGSIRRGLDPDMTRC